MTIASLLAVVDGGPNSASVLNTAFDVAKTFDARVEVLHVVADPRTVMPMMAEGMAAGMARDIMETTREQEEERAKAARKAFEEAVAAAGVEELSEDAPGGGFKTFWRQIEGTESTEVRRRARLFDLTVLGRPDMENDAYATVTVEAALMESGRPVLLAPPGDVGSLLDHAVVAWDGSVQAARALGAALPFLAKAKKVTVLSVTEDEKGADPENVATYLGRHGIEAEVHASEPGEGIGLSLLETASTLGAHMLVMGGYGHSRLREFVLGGVTESVLRSAGLPILMAH